LRGKGEAFETLFLGVMARSSTGHLPSRIFYEGVRMEMSLLRVRNNGEPSSFRRKKL
jgi:hypothetical protein